MTVILDSRWSLPSNVFIGGGNDRLFFLVISTLSCHFDPSLSFRLKGEIFVPTPSFLLRVNSGRDLKDSSKPLHNWQFVIARSFSDVAISHIINIE